MSNINKTINQLEIELKKKITDDLILELRRQVWETEDWVSCSHRNDSYKGNYYSGCGYSDLCNDCHSDYTYPPKYTKPDKYEVLIDKLHQKGWSVIFHFDGDVIFTQATDVIIYFYDYKLYEGLPKGVAICLHYLRVFHDES